MNLVNKSRLITDGIGFSQIHADHLMTLLQQPPRQISADKSADAGNEYFFP